MRTITRPIQRERTSLGWILAALAIVGAFAGLIVWLLRISKRVKKLEKEAAWVVIDDRRERI